MQKITPFLWFNTQAEEAANFYTSIFKNAKTLGVSCNYEAGSEITSVSEGTPTIVEFELEGQKFSAINGGPQFTFSPAISFTVNCDSQEEVDYYWDKLSEGGDESAQQCGWLKDKYGLSWQIVPTVLGQLLSSRDRAQSARVMQALLQMKKIDIAGLEAAYKGA